MNIRKEYTKVCLFLCILGMCFHAHPILAQSVIPVPLKMEKGTGSFLLSEKTRLYTNLQGREAKLWENYLKALPVQLKEARKKDRKQMLLLLITPKNHQLPSPESYTLSVTPQQILIRATSGAGLFYGMQTLLQLAQPSGAGSYSIASVEIEDTPRFAYRGLMLDVSRHFSTKEFIKKQIDALAYYKINRLHLHLTDAAGWRLEIKKYPLLTEFAAWRTDPTWKQWWNGGRKYVRFDAPGAYGGYYTQDDIREILEYARQHYITVIPEIEMPSHSEEVLAAYPQLSCSGEPYKNSDFCVGNEETFTFLENVLTEVMELFPSEYIHIGGDEARKIAWKTCSKCQTLMEKEGLKDLEELQCYMIARMEAFLTSKGKRMIGWDEVLNNHLAPTSTIISYRGQETASEAANRGYNVVFTPGAALYFDWYQATPETQPRAMIGYSPIKKVYSIYPVAADSITALHNEELIQGKQLKPNSVQWVRPEKMKYVVGVQGCAWTEFMNDEKQLEYMIFPRLLAVAEMAWTQEKKRDWQDFKPRMNAHIPQLQARGINTFTLTDEIELTTRLLKPGKMEVVLDTEKYPVEIRYTLDGTNPTMSSLKYEKPFVIHDSVVVKAAIFREERMVEPILVQKVGVIEEITNYFEYIEPEHWKELNL